MIDGPPRLPPKPTMVVGGYGYRNAGDEAILDGLLRLLGRDGVTVVSRSPDETRASHRVASVSIARAPRAMLRHRGLVVGGGGLFGRDMGRLGRLLPVAGLLTAASGREVALVGIGADRDMPPSSARLLAALGRRSTTVTVRDAESQAVLSRLGIGAERQPDLSALVPSAGRDSGETALRVVGLDPARRRVIGLSLTAVDRTLGGQIVAAVAACSDALPDVDFCLIPMSRHPTVSGHDDTLLAGAIAGARPRIRILVPPPDAPSLLGVFEALDVAVCMRYHSLLFAERAGVPIVAIPYAEKCRHWLDEHDVAPTEPSADRLLAALRQALAGGNP